MPFKAPIHRIASLVPGRQVEQARRSDAFYHSAEWRRLRNRVLDRDGYQCQLRHIGCDGRGVIADHILDRSRGGADVMGNLRACCVPCHNRRHPEKGTASQGR